MKKPLYIIAALGLAACKQHNPSDSQRNFADPLQVEQTDPSRDAVLVLPKDPCGRHVVLLDDGNYYTVEPDGKLSAGVLVGGTFTKDECKYLAAHDNMSPTRPMIKVTR